MFERYTEKARRAVFYARYETSDFGYPYIEADFLLLGIARENPELMLRWLGVNYAQLRESLAPKYSGGKRIATNVDLPLSNPSKRALAYAGEEANRLGDRLIGTEHLFLGLLREGGTTARMLKVNGHDIKEVRKDLSENPDRLEKNSPRSSGSSMVRQIRLMAEDGSEIETLPWQGRTLRIGEAIRLPKDAYGEITYRILDLCWRYLDSEIPIVRDSEILLTVRKEKP